MTIALPTVVVLTIAFALLMAGAVTAWSSAAIAKRAAGVVVAQTGAIAALAALGATQGVIIGAVAVLFAYCVVGASLLVRLQEDYGAAESAEIDAADAGDEPAEPRA